MIKVYIIDKNLKDNYIKVLKKKISYEGIPDIVRRKERFINKRKRRDIKRAKKHAFRKHIKYSSIIH